VGRPGPAERAWESTTWCSRAGSGSDLGAAELRRLQQESRLRGKSPSVNAFHHQSGGLPARPAARNIFPPVAGPPGGRARGPAPRGCRVSSVPSSCSTSRTGGPRASVKLPYRHQRRAQEWFSRRSITLILSPGQHGVPCQGHMLVGELHNGIVRRRCSRGLRSSRPA